MRCALLVTLCSLMSACSLWHNLLRASHFNCDERTQWFATSVQPLLEQKCMTCHSSSGLAQNTSFVLRDGDTDNNLAAFISVAQRSVDGTPVVLLKPTGGITHTGGKLAPPGSADYATLEKMVGIVGSCTVELTADGLLDPTAPTEYVPNDPNVEGPFVATYLPATVRRLSFDEYDASVQDLLGTTTKASASLAGDVRQSNFTANLDQRIDGTTSDQLFAVAQALADETTQQRLQQVVPCDMTKTGCDRTFVTAFATKAFRRPATSDEVTKLLAVFHAAADNGYAFADGVNAVIAAVLQSASFLYVPQVGAPGSDGLNALDSTEVASVLSYLATGHAPDQALQAAATANELTTPDQREAHLRRLLANDPHAKDQLVRFVREWLGLDGLDNVQRGAAFADLRPSIEAETAAFVKRAIEKDGARIDTLLAADFTVVDAPLATFYGLPGPGEQSLVGTPRRGVLSQAAFLATKAHENYTSPVKRGAATLSKLLCTDLPLPQGDVGKAAMAPLPADPTLTTRERFKQHSTNQACAGCHTVIDPLGFAFESFDQTGAFRSTDNGKPVDSTGELTGTDVDGPYKDAAEMMGRLATSEKVSRCVTTFVARFASTKTAAAIERTFSVFVASLPVEKRSSLTELMVAYVRSDVFMKRSIPQ